MCIHVKNYMGVSIILYKSIGRRKTEKISNRKRIVVLCSFQLLKRDWSMLPTIWVPSNITYFTSMCDSSLALFQVVDNVFSRSKHIKVVLSAEFNLHKLGPKTYNEFRGLQLLFTYFEILIVEIKTNKATTEHGDFD